MKPLLISLFSVCFIPATLCGQDEIIVAPQSSQKMDVALDVLFEPGKVWNQTDAEVEAAWKEKGFRWSSANAKDRGTIRRDNPRMGGLTLKIFGGAQGAEEVAFLFKAGKLSEIAIAVWNKGDSKDAEISEKDFIAMVDSTTRELSKRIAPRFEDRGRDRGSASRAERRMWVGKDTLAQLEYSGGKERVSTSYYTNRTEQVFQGEFIRIRLLPKPASLIGLNDALNAKTGGTASVTRATLAKSVKRESNGDVFIPGIPMVDQGDKGYCAVASAARVFNYYGVPADQHDMAQVSGNAAGGGGTNPDEMVDAMKKISGKYRTRFQTELDMDYTSRKYESFMRKYNNVARKIGKKQLDTDNYIYLFQGLDPEVLREVNGAGAPYAKFIKIVQDNINKGVPVMWALQLGMFPEDGLKARQMNGGHMRLIIGYNMEKGQIIFSDSWGAGHEMKRMSSQDASAATMGLYLLQPAM